MRHRFIIFLFLCFIANFAYADVSGAQLALQQNRFAEAAEEFRAVIQAEGANMQAQAGLAEALFALERYDEIVAFFPEEIRKGNINLNQRSSEAMAILKNIGLACYRSGQSKKSIVALSIAVKIRDDDPAVYNTLGLAYLHTGAHRLAELAFQTAVNLAPENSPYWNNLGAAYLEQQQYRDALISFESSVRSDRSYNTGWWNIWLCREKLGLPSHRGEYLFWYFITATADDRLAHQRVLDEERRKQDAILAAKRQQEEERLAQERAQSEAEAELLRRQEAEASDEPEQTGETEEATPEAENPNEG
ncbi:MAG: tetratricopeptide repeat protein [Spirochaetota bacterium]|jgi:tetratricopeptide (TPR) repeat protein|nr:tetratricopeptide repeat protein [Spirochaetota bacterium]